MNQAENEGKWLAYEKKHGLVSKKHESDKVLAFERNGFFVLFLISIWRKVLKIIKFERIQLESTGFGCVRMRKSFTGMRM